MGTGYTRQSAADIVDGLPITAAPLNAEFNLIKDAFDASTGHSHDGTAGESQKIVLTAAANVTGTLPLANGGTGSTDAATARTALGLGSMALQNSTAVAITGGTESGLTRTGGTLATSTITSSPISGSTGSFTTLTSPSVNLTGGTISGVTFSSSATTITGGAISGVTLSTNSATITGGTITGITDLAIADGGTGASNASNARTNLGVAIGTDVQAQSAALQSIAGLTTSANQQIYTTAANTYATTSYTAYARSLDATIDAASFKALLSLVKGDVGLGNVDNTSDASKPVSTATTTALNTKLNRAGDTVTPGSFTINSTSNNNPLVLLSDGNTFLSFYKGGNATTRTGYIQANGTGLTINPDTGSISLAAATTVTGALTITDTINSGNGASFGSLTSRSAATIQGVISSTGYGDSTQWAGVVNAAVRDIRNVSQASQAVGAGTYTAPTGAFINGMTFADNTPSRVNSFTYKFVQVYSLASGWFNMTSS